MSSRQYARRVSKGENASVELNLVSQPAQQAEEQGDSHRARMRLVNGGLKPVVELTTPIRQNRLYEAYRALRARGIQVIHTAVRRVGDTVVQLLHLAEADGREFTSRRLRETLTALSRDCGVMLMRPSRRAVQWLEPKLPTLKRGPSWQSYAT